MRREVCWDTHIVECAENVSVRMHKPIRRNDALVCDVDWEGPANGYPAVVKVGGKYRLYYRAADTSDPSTGVICMAESDDGITFTRPDLGIHAFKGSKHNNIIVKEDRFIDNFSVCMDTNPDCPEDEKFKAVSLYITEPDHRTLLALYKSPDGIHFRMDGFLNVKGVFDTYNVLFWDEKNKYYRLYLRDFHNRDGSDAVYIMDEAYMADKMRDVRLSVSADLVNWTQPKRLCFAADTEDIQLYTNQITKYHRADIFIGFPVRYANRVDDAAMSNFDALPQWKGLRGKRIEEGSRGGTAATDTILMTSRDGICFDRWDEVFFTSGLEAEGNWAYGDCYLSYGLMETPVEGIPGKTELSFVTGRDYRIGEGKFVRYTVRLDGFFSWHGNFKGGTVLTKEIVMDGNTLCLNFASSAIGGIRVQVCDTDGSPLDGYDSGVLFGDSLDRKVVFAKNLSELKGKSVKLRFTIKDCDLYSFAME